jgi:hypothetical protein
MQEYDFQLGNIQNKIKSKSDLYFYLSEKCKV